MQIINSARSQKAAPCYTTELGNSMEKFNKYLDSNLLKCFPQTYDANGATVATAVKNAVSISTDATTPLRQIDGQTSHVATPSPLEQYRLQLYNYALNIDRLRCTQHNTTAAYASSAVPGLHLVINGENNRNFGSIDMKMESNYTCPSISSVRPYVPVALAHGNRLDLSMSLFPQRMFRTEEPKPQYSYIGLIAMAILSSAETKLVLSEIYQHILDNYPYFRARGPGWRNSIRHNLSLNDCFIKSGRSANGKGHYWAIHPANIDDFRRGDFRRRKAQRKVRKHMGLSIDDASTDSPSPPPLDLTSTQLTSTRLLRIAPPGNSLTATQDFRTPNALAFSCLHPLLQMPSSFSLQQAQQQIQDSYFGTAIMEQYTCMPSAPAYNNGYSASLQQEYYKFCNNAQVDNIRPNDNIMPLCAEQSLSDNHKNSKHALYNGTALSTVAPNALRDTKTNYYTHMHKRQFDVASLLAPDRKLFATTLRDKEQHIPTFDALEHTQILKKNLEEHGNHEPQVTHATHKSLYTLPVTQAHKLTPLTDAYECEPEQDEIDVVANDIDERSKESFSCNADNTNEEEQQQQVFGAIANNVTQIYDNSDNENNTPHRRGNAMHHHPSAVIEWRMVQQQPLSVEKLIKKFGAGNACNTTSNTIGFEDCYATKITATTTVNPMLNSKSMTLEEGRELGHSNCKKQIELCEHEPNAITINAAGHKSLHVRRIIQHLQQQQQQNQETLKEAADDKESALSRHYSTYITAAATRHIGPMQLKQIQCQQQKCDIISKRR
ncbi:uncharacterized protein LOC128923031 [Zeugodacus cucurbitae]|uniref:uncharacterized protein LOC128923031 n=1 Tax=Zeugodacus cucurbitae TaxID=28588 RepID=UPI000596AAAD|nr:uncharacterized protein LOC128923031 [Zeugodacus cucurbitae]